MALSVVPWKKAVKLIVNGKAEAVPGSTIVRKIQSIRKSFGVPSVIRLLVEIPWAAHNKRIRFSRRNVVIRDNSKCQYCSKNIGKSSGTLDHVIPRSRGGKTDYNNCVYCCKDCNNTKGNRTPEEAGMKLIKKPKRPTFVSLYKSQLSTPPDEWKNFIIGL